MRSVGAVVAPCAVSVGSCRPSCNSWLAKSRDVLPVNLLSLFRVQAFVRLVSLDSKQEIIFVAEADRTLGYLFELVGGFL